MDSDDELLELAIHRKSALEALAAGARHRRELQEELSVSKTTCHRIVRAFDEHGLVRRTDSGYALTLFGRIVAAQATSFEATIETAARLRPLLKLIDASHRRFVRDVFVEGVTDWTVEGTESFSIDLGVERVKETELLRVLDWTPVPDLYHERILHILAENEAKIESIYPESEMANRLERFPDLHEYLLEAGARPRYWVYDDVPIWGMSIYDDSLVELRAYDKQSGSYTLEAIAETTRAVEWALDIFSEYRDRARPLTEVEGLPDWGDYTW